MGWSFQVSLSGRIYPNPVASLAAVYLLAWLFTQLNVTSGPRGGVLAFLITFCIFHLSEMRDNMFAGFPYGLAWITGGFNVVGNTLSGFILYLFDSGLYLLGAPFTGGPK